MSRSPTFVFVNKGTTNASSKDHAAIVKSHVSKQRKRKAATRTTEVVERLKSSSSSTGLWKSQADSWFSPDGKELSGLRTEIDYDKICKDDSTSASSPSSLASVGLKVSPSRGSRPREPDHATPSSGTTPPEELDYATPSSGTTPPEEPDHATPSSDISSRHYANQANPVRTVQLRAYPIRLSENAKLALQYCTSQAW
jgi:hypothetical protein